MADEIREHLATTQKGQTANTIGNCMIVFRADSMLRGVIRLNLLTERVDIVRDLGWRRMTAALTDTDMKYLRLYFEENYGITSSPKIEDALAIIANENRYHPIQDCLASLVWDKVPRIRGCLHHFLGAEQSDYVETCLTHFLLGAINRVFHPGCKYEEMLCLVGGQGAGKSTFFRLLAIQDEYIRIDKIIEVQIVGRNTDFAFLDKTGKVSAVVLTGLFPELLYAVQRFAVPAEVSIFRLTHHGQHGFDIVDLNCNNAFLQIRVAYVRVGMMDNIDRLDGMCHDKYLLIFDLRFSGESHRLLRLIKCRRFYTGCATMHTGTGQEIPAFSGFRRPVFSSRRKQVMQPLS